jgi:hypothetical protein
MYLIQHRETETVLLIESFGLKKRDSWLELKDIKHATKFATPDEAKAAATKFSLENKHYRIRKI